MTKARDLADLISAGNALEDGAISVAEISGVTATANELNVLDGITATTEELNNVAGVNSDVQTQLDGKQDVVSGVSDTEIGYLDGVTSNLQTQLDNITVTAGTLTKSFTSGETASIALSAALSPAPVVSVTKEVPQTGQSSKGAWDVATDGANYDRHNTAYDTTLTPSVVGYQWDSATALSGTLSYGGVDNYMQKVAFSTDGTKFYLTGDTNRYVYQYSLTTAWDISTASAGSSFDVGTDLGGAISSIAFKTDGTKMYVGTYTNDRFVEYTLSTAWDVTSASSPATFSDSTNLDTAIGMWFKPDGTRFYVSDFGSNHVKRFDLSTAWDITTSSYNSQYSLGSGSWRQLQFKSDGTAMYLLNDDASEDIREYTLSTAWDITTASLSGVEFSYASELGTNVPGFYIKPDDGATLYVMDNEPTPSQLRQYSISSSALTLGSGSFASTDVGKTIEGNGGEVILTATDGSYSEVTAFNDSSTIAAGSWDMYALTFDATNGVELSEFVSTFSYDLSEVDESSSVNNVTGSYSSMTCSTFNYTGTKLYMGFYSGSDAFVEYYTLSTAWDLSTASKVGTTQFASYGNFIKGLAINQNDDRFAVMFSNSNSVKEFIISGGDITGSVTFNVERSTAGSTPFGIQYASSPNNSNQWFYVYDYTNGVERYYLGTSPSIDGTFAHQETTSLPNGSTWVDGHVTPDGFKLYISSRGDDKVYHYSLSAEFDTSSIASLDSNTDEFNIGSLSSVSLSGDGNKLFVGAENPSAVYSYGFTRISFQPTGQYAPAITNSGGQIDTAFWTDINSMTADQTANDGEVYYAVSTDDRTTWSVIKDGDGVRPIVRDNAGTWEYNTAVTTVGYGLPTTYRSETASISSPHSNAWGFTFNSDGTKMYTADPDASNGIAEWDLSTAYDVSTLSLHAQVNVAGVVSSPISVFWKSDGTSLYMQDVSSPRVYQFAASTPFDATTLSLTKSSPSDTSPASGNGGVLAFSSDGTKLYMGNFFAGNIYMFDLSVAWEVDAYTHSGTYSTGLDRVGGIAFSPDGLTLLTANNNTGTFTLHSLSTAWDITTATVGASSTATVSQTGTNVISGGRYSDDGTKLIVMSNGNDAVYGFNSTQDAYTTSTTWTAATRNTEMDALQEALGATSVNRMDKTQLDAVADPNHYTLGDSLDLMIALYMGSNGTSPTSDGVSINYDAEALNQGAVLGTDYDYDFPDNTTVRITSNAAQNLKVRVV